MMPPINGPDGPAVPSGASSPVLYFDGVCHMCHGSVRWVIRRDKKKIFRFASLQSRHAHQHLPASLRSSGAADTVILASDGRYWEKSDAWLETLRRLGGFWSAVSWSRFLPRALRDGVYDWVARHRYRWFGRMEACPIPDPGLRDRFLD